MICQHFMSRITITARTAVSSSQKYFSQFTSNTQLASNAAATAQFLRWKLFTGNCLTTTSCENPRVIWKKILPPPPPPHSTNAETPNFIRNCLSWSSSDTLLASLLIYNFLLYKCPHIPYYDVLLVKSPH